MRQIAEVELLLRQLVEEHHRLIVQVDAHGEAMRRFDLDAMDAAARLQEAARLRITGLESRRRSLVQQVAKLLKVEGGLTVSRLADLHPPRREALLALREELRTAIKQVADRTHVTGRLAGSVLGHLNTAVRLLASAVEERGVYTKQGIPRMAPRIGVLEAVG